MEILIDTNVATNDQKLAVLAPGDHLIVSLPLGSGFVPMFDSGEGLSEDMEEGRALLLVAVGTRGIAAMRSAVEWQPVQAHATQRQVIYISLYSISTIYIYIYLSR